MTWDNISPISASQIFTFELSMSPYSASFLERSLSKSKCSYVTKLLKCWHFQKVLPRLFLFCSLSLDDLFLSLASPCLSGFRLVHSTACERSHLDVLQAPQTQHVWTWIHHLFPKLVPSQLFSLNCQFSSLIHHLRRELSCIFWSPRATDKI